MSNLDMAEAVRMLANEKGISVDTLLQVLVEALATAYKKRPGAADEVIVEINPDNLDMRFTAYDLDDDGNWVQTESVVGQPGYVIAGCAAAEPPLVLTPAQVQGIMDRADVTEQEPFVAFGRMGLILISEEMP